MRLVLTAPNPDQIERLAASARQRPGVYRAWLTVLAVLGDVVLTFVRVLPWAVFPVFGALWYGQALFYWGAGLATLFFIWLERPRARVPGEPITAAEAPVLFSAIDRIATTLDIGRQIEVRLDDEMNASALDTRGLFGLLGGRTVLTLGIPLLQLLPQDEVEAVIAHELGHFSRRHGRLGHWLYRAHAGWVQHIAEINESSSGIDRFGAAFAQMFVPYFSPRAAIHSRQCEFEADADAARASSAGALARALTCLALFRTWHAQDYDAVAEMWRRRQSEPPTALLARTIDVFRTLPAAKAQPMLDRALSMTADWRDTHPPLAARLAALQQVAKISSTPKPAGESLLGTSWRAQLVAHDQRWRAANRHAWTAAHLRYEMLERPLIMASAAEAAGWDADQCLQRVRVLLRSDRSVGRPALVALVARHPSHLGIAFAMAEVQVDEDDVEGLAALEAVWRQNACFRLPAYACLATYHTRRGGHAVASQWEQRLQLADLRRRDAAGHALQRLDAGEADAAMLSDAAAACLFRSLAIDPTVHAAWLLSHRAPLATAENARAAELLIHTLVVVLAPDPRQPASEPLDEPAKRYELATVLGALVPPEDDLLVSTRFLTEGADTIRGPRLRQVPSQHQFARGHEGIQGEVSS